MKKIAYIAAFNFLPLVAFAQTFGGGNLSNYLSSFVNFINQVIIPLLIAIAILVFIWGMFSYFILGAADEEKRDKGKQLIMWGLVGFVLMFSIMGIVNLFTDLLGLKDQDIGIPQVPNNIGGGRN